MRASIVLMLALISGGQKAARPAATLPAGFTAVVNEANGVTRLSTVELSKLFLRKTSRWPSGIEVVPVELAEATVREAFSEGVHHKSVAAVRSYWQQQIFSGRGVPPVERASNDEVLDFVRATPGAVGYVAAGTSLGAGVKAIQVVD